MGSRARIIKVCGEEMIPTILDTVTGEKKKVDSKFDNPWWWWSEGNGSCDCNRSIAFGKDDELDELMRAKHPELERWQSICYGFSRFLIVGVDGDCGTCSMLDFNADYPKELVDKYINLENKMSITIESIAKCCHMANKALCEAICDYTQREWEYADDWQRESAVNGVRHFIENPDAPDSAQHDAWCDDKYANGWVYGETKDAIKKTHPCLVPFESLPPEQQAKDVLFKAVCRSLCSLL